MTERIVDSIRNNRGEWLSNGSKHVSGQLTGVERHTQGIKILTSGGPVYWRMPASVAETVIDQMAA